ncbi:MAG: tRNA 2-thiouridine(34) synthase MnmA [Kiritimatiellae bacterium]|nr:tRNA 2-thiouridine(34) synthase MnmA [Kiritimatiellia bacterium]
MRVAIGLSGGVDSSVAALLLKEQGHDVVGITMRLWKGGKYKGGERTACYGECEKDNIESASLFAKKIGIDYQVFDCSEEYDKTIVSYFRDAYLDGITPNPCVYCNPIMKFGLLPKLAEESGLKFDAFATGHYVRVEKKGDRFALLRAKDLAKDQSYFLYRLSQKQLSRQLFPMGNMTKVEAREFARERGLIVANRPDSQDFYSGEISELIGKADCPGDIVDLQGKKLGTHRGYWHYTIGQRKGLGIGGAKEPYYVVELDAKQNRLIVGTASDAVRYELTVRDMNWVSIEETQKPIECRVKIRSTSEPKKPAILEGNKCVFPEGIAGVAPGQSAVFYALDSEEVLCGGIINSPK